VWNIHDSLYVRSLGFLCHVPTNRVLLVEYRRLPLQRIACAMSVVMVASRIATTLSRPSPLTHHRARSRDRGLIGAHAGTHAAARECLVRLSHGHRRRTSVRRKGEALVPAARFLATRTRTVPGDATSIVPEEEIQEIESLVTASSANNDTRDDAFPRADGLPRQDAQRIIFVCAFAMLLASADRTIFSLASLAIANDLDLTMATVGILQSAFLWGYGATQVLGGVAADTLGGARVLLFGLFFWSLAVAVVPASAVSPFPVATLIAARFLFGAASGCAVPAAAAAVAAYVPSDRKSVGLSTVFASFNLGSAFGLLLAGGVIKAVGWQSVFTAFGGAGVLWSIVGFALLPSIARRTPEKSETTVASEGAEKKKNAPTFFFTFLKKTPPWMLAQLAALAWCHACANFGFFQLQSWLPAYMARDLGFTLGSSGVIAALPWFVCAFASFFSGKMADAAIRDGAERWIVRRFAMRFATVGPCASLLALAALNGLGFLTKTTAQGSGLTFPIVLAIGLVASTLAAQAVAIAGFHAYLQDVAPARAGSFLGVTNTLGVFAGIAANVVTGVIVEKTGAFDYVFVVTAMVYLSSGVVWEMNMRGKQLFPNDARAP